ncbi:biopolymer transporter ExbD [Yoonia sp. R2-816]|uniref:biopolymer transporter ExbD n=1 Tax=Yoonia sp. R2-816 TaxID=3342638 RepID=UPI003728C8A4
MRRRTARRRLSMTSLIDIIFLLLLFFMLSSTFSKFGLVPLPLGTSGAVAPTAAPVFVKVEADTVTLNGDPVALKDLATALTQTDPVTAILSLGPDVTAQRLTDVLTAVRVVANLSLNVLVPA